MRINNLWRIINNSSENVWVWAFETDSKHHALPITGQLFKLNAGDQRDTDIRRDRVQIGFRKGNTVFDGWVAAPVFVDTDRDVELTNKKKISFPDHRMFDQVDHANNVVFLTPAKTNNLARQAVTLGLSKIPEVGGIISGVVGVLWKEQKLSMDELIEQSEKRMKSWVRGQIDDLKRETLENLLRGLLKNLNEYLTATTAKRKRDWLGRCIGDFNDNMPFFTSKNYTVGTVGIGVEVATMHIALMRERVVFAKELGINPEEKEGDIKKLNQLIDEYADHVLEVAVPAEIAWRIDSIDVTNEVGLASYKGYYLRDTVARQTFFFSDVVRGTSRNTSNSVVNRNYYLRQAENSYTNSLITNVADTARLWALLKINEDVGKPVAMDRLTWVGPCSGLIYKGGNEHGATENVVMDTHGHIKELIVRGGDEIDYLKVVYQDGKSKAIGNAKGGKETKIILKPDVYIIKIDTWWDWELRAIQFHMSDGSSSPKIGDQRNKGGHYQTAVMDNHILSGFKVEASKAAAIGNGISFGFVPKPDFYDTK